MAEASRGRALIPSKIIFGNGLEPLRLIFSRKIGLGEISKMTGAKAQPESVIIKVTIKMLW